MSTMSTPTVHELPARQARVEHDDFAEAPRRPRMAPYNRAAEREMIRASLLSDLHTHAYDRESTR